MRIVLITTLFVLLYELGLAATFNSNASGQFNSAASWIMTSGSDSDGIPDGNDDVTILSGHVITCSSLSTSNSIIRSVIILTGGTLTVSTPRQLTIWGNYQNDGTELGNGLILFNNGIGTGISGTGVFSPTCRYTFNVGANRTVALGTTIDKTACTTMFFSATVTNLGTFKINTTSFTGTGLFINGATGILYVKAGSAFPTGRLDASAGGNIVYLQYYSLNVPSSVGGIYHHLFIAGTGALQLNSDITCNGNFTINGGNGFVQNNYNLTVKGNFQKSGNFTSSNSGEILMNGSVPQTISIAGATPVTFGNLRIDNAAGVTLTSGSYIINRSLTATNGNLDINNSVVVFNSDAVATAVIGDCSGGNFLNAGNLQYKRYIDARSAGYSDVASSITSGAFTDWDDDNTMVYYYSPPGYYPSAWGYDETTFDFVPITSAATAMTPGVGYELYLDSDGTQTSWNAATVDFAGTPTIGDVDMSSYVTNSNDGWNLVGNPYHANLDWDALYAASSGISTDIMFYDETISDYTTVTTGSGVLIAPEQGFWVQVLAAPTFTFTENIKSTSNSSTFRKPSQELFGLRLKNENGIQFTSGTHYRFDENPVTAIKGDLNFKKLPHPQAPALYSLNNKYGLKIKLLNASNQSIEIPLGIQINVSGLYTISPEFLNEAYNQGFNCVQLIDHKANTITNLNQEAYQFFANEGKDESRFSLKLSKEQNCSANTNSFVDQISISRIGENAIVKFNFDHDTNVKLTITNAIGQELIPAQIIIVNNEQKSYTLPSDFEGIFMVNIWVDGKIISKKLFK